MKNVFGAFLASTLAGLVVLFVTIELRKPRPTEPAVSIPITIPVPVTVPPPPMPAPEPILPPDDARKRRPLFPPLIPPLRGDQDKDQ